MARDTHVHVNLHLTDVERRLDLIDQHLKTINQNLGVLMSDLAHLTQEVQESVGVQQSAITLLNELAEMLRDAANSPAEISALADQLDAQSNALADAIAAATPGAPA